MSGYIDGDGGRCEGAGFVRIGDGGWFEGPIALGATVITIVIIIIIVIVGRTIPSLPPAPAPSGNGLPGSDEIFTDGFESGDTSAWGSDK